LRFDVVVGCYVGLLLLFDVGLLVGWLVWLVCWLRCRWFGLIGLLFGSLVAGLVVCCGCWRWLLFVVVGCGCRWLAFVGLVGCCCVYCCCCCWLVVGWLVTVVGRLFSGWTLDVGCCGLPRVRLVGWLSCLDVRCCCWLLVGWVGWSLLLLVGCCCWFRWFWLLLVVSCCC